MKLKKFIAGCLFASILSYTSIATFAISQVPVKFIESTTTIEDITTAGTDSHDVNPVYFGSFTGTVKEIKDFSPIEGSKFVSLESSEGSPANIIISRDTYIVNHENLKVGALLTAYYDANAPMILIYPPQYNAEVVVINNKDQNVKVDKFDKDLVSSDGMLKLNIGEDTEILLPNGETFKGELANRKLVVIYGMSTKSIPAQTTPTQIIVLSEKIEAVPTPPSDEDAHKSITLNIVPNHQQINAFSAYLNDKNTVMVPLRTAAEALGYEVTWDGQLKEVQVGKSIRFTLNQDNYSYMKTAPMLLGTAPQLVEETTFVPLNFFEKVMSLEKVEANESQVILMSK